MARRSGRVIDFKAWAAISGQTTSIAAAQTTTFASLSFTFSATILRLRGWWMVSLDGAADTDINQVVLGIGVVSTDAVAGAALPDPSQEPEFPWVFWDTATVAAILPDAGSAQDFAFNMAVTRQVIDSKAMRKVRPSQSLVAVVQTTSAAPVDVTVGPVRVLFGT